MISKTQQVLHIHSIYFPLFIFLFDIEVDKSFNITYQLEFICQKLKLTIIK